MTQEEFKTLKRGDVVRNTGSGRSYVIMDDMPPFPAVDLVHISNPFEWEKFTISPSEPTRRKATMETLIWVLNQLQGAPGQPNRELVRQFLYVKGWIGPLSLPEEWALEHCPVKKSAVKQLAGELHQFAMDAKKPGTEPEKQGQ